MDFKQTQTHHNLAKAFAGECQAGARYQFLRQRAESEGYHAIAKIFQQEAVEEMAHAKRYWQLLTEKNKEVVANVEISGGYPFKEGNLTELITFASENELDEFKLYPKFAETALKEGFKDIHAVFMMVSEIERVHNLRAKEIAAQLKGGTLYKRAKEQTWVCTGCGHHHTGKEAPGTCPVCLAKQGYYDLILENKQ